MKKRYYGANARGDAEILLASPATEAAGTIRTAAIVSIDATARWANRLAVCLGPADLVEHFFRLRIGHAEDLSEAQGLCCRREEEVLDHVRSRF